MSITLGSKPENLHVILTRDADFFTTLQNADGNWPATAEIELRFSGNVVWSATIENDLAIFSVDSVEVNNLIDAKPRLAKLFYIDGPTEICWGLGAVVPSA